MFMYKWIISGCSDLVIETLLHGSDNRNYVIGEVQSWDVSGDSTIRPSVLSL